MKHSLIDITWPTRDLGEAMYALGQRSGMSRNVVRSHGSATPRNDADLQIAVDQTAAEMGIEAEPISASYSRVEQLIHNAAPALLRIAVNDETRLLLLLQHDRKRIGVLTPAHEVVNVPPNRIKTAICQHVESSVDSAIDQVLAATKMSGRMSSARTGLLNELLRESRVDAGWMLRHSPAANIVLQAKELGLPRLLIGLLLTQAIHAVLWIVSWWLLGSAVLSGRLDLGWLTAWAFTILSLVPFRILASFISGVITVRGSVLMKRRLLFGALQLEPDQTGRLGAGQLLGRVLESDVLDTMALTGGFLTVTAIVDLLVAGLVLAMGTAGVVEALLLVTFLVVTFFIGNRYYRRRLAWTDERLAMTDDLVERMQGHRTRLAQQPRDQWNRHEDAAVSAYLDESVVLDRNYQRLKILIPRGWSLAAMLGLTPFFVFGGPSSAGLGIAVGGILLAYGALQSLTQGLEDLTGAAIAWNRVKLFWNPAQPSSKGQSQFPIADKPAEGTTVVECGSVSFRYPGRGATVLDNVDLKIKAGHQVLLEGDSGGGKSTLGKLLAAMRIPDAGVITCQGLDRQTLGEEAWRRRVVLAPQFHENHVLQGTFAFNLLLGREWPARECDLREATRICQRLGLGPLLERMPGGVHQMVGETGWQLSHGERSRLFLGRALLQRADLIIMDESFAALDPETLCETLKFVLEEAPTVLLIAHP